jgi:hypothetical protein
MDCKRVVVLALVATACTEATTIPSRLDGPFRADVLEAAEGPFSHPVALVANSRSGLILPVDLARGWLLSDANSTPFLAADAIAAGANRALGDLVVHSPDGDAVDVFVVDMGSEELLQIPWISGVNGSQFERVEPTLAGSVLFQDLDNSGGNVRLLNLQMERGATTTEDWTLRFNGQSWDVEGSAAGRQSGEAFLGLPYRSDYDEVRFTLVGEATVGDELHFSTDTGIQTHDLGGAIQEFKKVLGTGGLALLSLRDRFDQSGRLVFFDLNAGQAIGDLPLPSGSMPFRMDIDAEGARAFVVDVAQDVVHVIEIDQVDPVLSSVSTLALDFPVSDVAFASGDSYAHLFLARADRNEVVVWDLNAGAQRDVNLSTPEADGIQLKAPVVGLATSVAEVYLPETTGFGARYRDRTVAIATFAGELWLAEASTGCFVQDEVGPYAYTETGGYFFDEGQASNPDLEDANGLGEKVEVSACGGVVRDEDWTVTFDALVGTWRVEGSLAGKQVNRAVEEERYVSDNGAVSFLIATGTAMSTQGDQFKFTTRAGVVVARGDTDSDGQLEIQLEAPGRPVAFSWQEPAKADEGWMAADPQVGLFWPIGNSDVALILDGASAETEAVLD